MKKHFYDPEFRLGVLGGGQLGRMLIQASIDWNIPVLVLDKDHTVPAYPYAREFISGSFAEYEDVIRLKGRVDLATIEIEHVSLEGMEELERSGIQVYPSPRVLRIIKDKGLQKEFYRDNGIPTSEFYLIESKKDLMAHSELLPVFQKSRKAGYDGKGVQKLTTKEDLKKGFDVPSVVEKQVDFIKELSVIVARGKNGEIAVYSPVEMAFHPTQNLVEFLFAPSELGKKTEKEAVELAGEVVRKLDCVGLLAVEMFLDDSGNLLVNEVAPRPHNSGHHTIEANETNQYKQHLRAITGMALGSTKLRTPAVMVNLLGEPGHHGEPVYQGIEKVIGKRGIHVHLYGKQETRPYRKMGHVTVTANTLDDAKEMAYFVKKQLKVVT